MKPITHPTQDLDVRPMLAAGEEPFAVIMEAIEALPSGTALRLIAPFRPTPLFSVLSRMGFSADPTQRPDGHWEVLFRPEAPLAPEPGLAPGTTPDAMYWPDPARSLDLTALPPPEPMVHILTALEEMAAGEVLFALLDREPLLLFPELALRGHEWAGNHTSDRTSYRLMIRRGATE